MPTGSAKNRVRPGAQAMGSYLSQAGLHLIQFRQHKDPSKDIAKSLFDV